MREKMDRASLTPDIDVKAGPQVKIPEVPKLLTKANKGWMEQNEGLPSSRNIDYADLHKQWIAQ